MKRISVLALLACLFLSSQTWAWYRYSGSMRNRVHYSTHAFGKDHSGLIPGHNHYSVYDMGLHGNGLISDCVRYSPYAFGTRHNGLIHNYSGWAHPCRSGWLCGTTTCVKQDITKDCTSSRRSYCIPASTNASRKRIARRPNTREIVRQHLAQHIPGNFRIKHPFFLNGQYTSFDIISDQGDTLIKYWNPEMVAHIKQSRRLSKHYTNYLIASAKRCKEHQKRGGKIHHVITSSAAEICVALDQTLGRTPADKTYCKKISTVNTP